MCWAVVDPSLSFCSSAAGVSRFPSISSVFGEQISHTDPDEQCLADESVGFG